jgi:hypothetical protein
VANDMMTKVMKGILKDVTKSLMNNVVFDYLMEA